MNWQTKKLSELTDSSTSCGEISQTGTTSDHKKNNFNIVYVIFTNDLQMTEKFSNFEENCMSQQDVKAFKTKIKD